MTFLEDLHVKVYGELSDADADELANIRETHEDAFINAVQFRFPDLKVVRS